MDRRLDARYQTNLAATVTDITSLDRVASGQVVNLSRDGACAILSMRLEPDTIVKLEIDDCTMFGHVTYCEDEPAFRTGIEIVRVLIGESDLSRLLNVILLETMPETPGVLPARV
jgi:hypothetical protein